MPEIAWIMFAAGSVVGLIAGFATGVRWERYRPPEETDDGPLN